MLRAIFWKELRELFPAIVVAIALQAFIIYAILGVGRKNSLEPGDLHGVAFFLTQVSFLFVLIIGIWQNKVEKNQGTFLFLLHRPVRREVIVGTKLLAGACICIAVAVLPLASFSYWAVEKQSIRDPGDSLWNFSWPVCAGILLVYLGAFMSSLREAAWYKSQFLPLFAAIALFISLAMIAKTWTLTMLVALVIIAIGFLLAIFYQAMTRNYS